MQKIDIQYIEIFNDNYIWLIISADKLNAVAVDPGDSGPVIAYLDAENITLTDILITHHHFDHTGGILDLAKIYDLNVYGPYHENIPGVTVNLQEGDKVCLESIDLELTVIEVPGHTLGHIAYYSENYTKLFCGDTLFSAGCGRVFEGTTQQMYASLQKLMNLPDTTQIYCTHEYTLQNLKFAEFIEPENLAIKYKIKEVESLQAKLTPSLPTTLADEKEFNPFLRCKEPALLEALSATQGVSFASAEDTFKCLRKLKDNF